MNSRTPLPSPDLWRRAIAALAMGLGAAVLIGGWWLDVTLLRSLHPGFANMKANTAVALATAGLALWLLTEGASPPRRRIGRAGAWLTIAIGALTLAQYLGGWDLGIDRLLVADTASGYGLPGRLAPNTALALVLLGLSLLLLDRQTRRGQRPSEWLALGAALIAWLGLLGYLYGTHPLYRFSAHYAMALHTAALLALLAIGVWLARPRAGMMAVLAGASPGGHLARRMIPVTLVSLPLLDVIVGAGVPLGYYDVNLATALQVTLASAVFLAAIALIARSSHLLNLRHEQVTQQNRLLAGAVTQTADSVIITDRDGVIVYVNPAFEIMTGYSSAEALGYKPSLVKSGQHDKSFYRDLWTTILRGEPFRAVFANRRKDGANYQEQQTIAPIEDRQGQIMHFVSTGRDISEQTRQEAKLRESEERFRQVTENIREVFWLTTPDKNQMLYVSPGYQTVWGRSCESLYAEPRAWLGAIHADDRERVLRAALTDQVSGRYAVEYRIQRPDGAERRIFDRAFPVRDAGGEVYRIAGVAEDITERKHIEQSLQDSEARLHAIIEAVPEGIALLRIDGTLMQTNATGLAMVEADSAEAVLGRCVFDLVIAPEYHEQARTLIEHVARGGHAKMQYEIVGLKGTRRWVETQGVPFHSPAIDGPNLIVAVTRDISEQKRTERELLQLAHYDTLTGLPNRLLFTDRLQQAMEHALRHERLVGAAMLDIDQFKKINDSLGHATGDALLRQVAERLRAALRPSDTVARLGGDEFTLVLADMAHESDVALVLQKIRQSFAAPFRVDDRELFVSVSMGVTLFPLDDQDVPALLRNAEVAMYRAKESGRNTWQFYAAEMTARVSENLAIETDLRGAIGRCELELHYQPQLNLATGRVVGVEALARWRHPRLGHIAPDRFIPIAEESGLIVPLGEWVLRTACEQAVRWRAAGFDLMRMAVNLSARQCHESDFFDKVRRILADTGLPPEVLEFEVTEGLLLQKIDGSSTALEQLDALGVRFAVDDFGTGYSSLSYLKRLPIDVLKIDRSFVRDIATDPDDAAIARAIITMAHSLGIEVVAEGVETREQQEFLRAHGCDAQQGYFFCRPQPPAALVPLLKKADVTRKTTRQPFDRSSA